MAEGGPSAPEGELEVNYDWELSKENVQPLRQGRNFAALSSALNSSAASLKQQIEYAVYNNKLY